MSEVASALPVNPQNKILLQLRDNKPDIAYPGFWGTFGGHCKMGETMEDCLKRELYEEINFKVKNLEFLFIFNDGVGNKVHLYKVLINKRLSELKLNEGQKMAYFSYKDIMNLHTPKKFKKILTEHKKEIFH